MFCTKRQQPRARSFVMLWCQILGMSHVRQQIVVADKYNANKVNAKLVLYLQSTPDVLCVLGGGSVVGDVVFSLTVILMVFAVSVKCISFSSTFPSSQLSSLSTMTPAWLVVVVQGCIKYFSDRLFLMELVLYLKRFYLSKFLQYLYLSSLASDDCFSSWKWTLYGHVPNWHTMIIMKEISKFMYTVYDRLMS